MQHQCSFDVKCVVQLSAASVPAHLAMKEFFTCAEHSSTKENECPDVKDNKHPAAKDMEHPAVKDNNHGSAQWTTRYSKNSVAPGDRAKL
jgi:hypothetical protein